MRKVFMKNIVLIFLSLLIISPAFAEGIPIVRIENVDVNGVKTNEIKPMTGFKLLEFDPKTKSIKKLPDVETDKKIQNEVQVDNIKKEEEKDTKKIKLERIKFDGFET